MAVGTSEPSQQGGGQPEGRVRYDSDGNNFAPGAAMRDSTLDLCHRSPTPRSVDLVTWADLAPGSVDLRPSAMTSQPGRSPLYL
jgi:hypothetical protein